MNVVIVRPPSDAQASHEVRDTDPPKPVRPPVARQPRVTDVVSDEGDLMPERSERNSSDEVVEGGFGSTVRPDGEKGEGGVDEE
jgi:hypothetical protein